MIYPLILCQFLQIFTVYLIERYMKDHFESEYRSQAAHNNVKHILDHIPQMVIVVSQKDFGVLYTNDHYQNVVKESQAIYPGLS